MHKVEEINGKLEVACETKIEKEGERGGTMRVK